MTHQSAEQNSRQPAIKYYFTKTKQLDIKKCLLYLVICLDGQITCLIFDKIIEYIVVTVPQYRFISNVYRKKNEANNATTRQIVCGY
jgi:hypothetical protein